MKEYVSYNGTIQVFIDGDLVDVISKDDVVDLLNLKERDLEGLRQLLAIKERHLENASKSASDARWAADAANGLLRWGQ